MGIRRYFGVLWQFLKMQRRYFLAGVAVFVLLFVVLVSLIDAVTRVYAFWDDDADRGATIVAHDLFGDSYRTVRYLPQGWNTNQSLWFYNTTQGSDLLPYDFFMSLEKPGTTELLRSNENMNAYRYLPQKATFSNRDALPVGFVKDVYNGKEYFGLTCAACHTSQVNYDGVGIRIDGGPGAADMDKFIFDLEKSLLMASDTGNPAHKRFVKRVLDRGHYDSEQSVNTDLGRYQRRISIYRGINHPQHPYGYARLDAFGRIYNRVLEHVISGSALKQVLSELVLDSVLTETQFKDILRDTVLSNVLTEDERDHIIERVSRHMTRRQQLEMRDRLFNKPTAPVSYPFLWDIPQHDFVQWNGVVSNAGIGPIGRNTGEAIGVFATLDWSAKPGFSISSLIDGQGFTATHISYKSSVNVSNLRELERQLTSLESPRWSDAPLPKIAAERAARGAHLFDRSCANCHAEIDRSDPGRRVVAHISGVGEVGTDSMMARNSVKYEGRSGILRNQYVATSVGSILLDTRAPVAALLAKSVTGVVATPDPDHWWPRRGSDWARELLKAFFSNEIKPSIRRGKYNPDNTVDPFASLMSYKARSLNGIWATAPYLHNGSVPTLYDLLLPKRRTGDPFAGEFRPDTFEVGSRELDPVKVGFKSSGYGGFVFKTWLEGNSNAGHEYGARCAPPPLQNPPNTTCSVLTREQRLDLVEYLKTL